MSELWTWVIKFWWTMDVYQNLFSWKKTGFLSIFSMQNTWKWAVPYPITLYKGGKTKTFNWNICKEVQLDLKAYKYHFVTINKEVLKKVFLPFLTSKIKTAVCVCSHTWCEQTHTRVLILDVKNWRKTFFNTTS